MNFRASTSATYRGAAQLRGRYRARLNEEEKYKRDLMTPVKNSNEEAGLHNELYLKIKDCSYSRRSLKCLVQAEK